MDLVHVPVKIDPENYQSGVLQVMKTAKPEWNSTDIVIEVRV